MQYLGIDYNLYKMIVFACQPIRKLFFLFVLFISFINQAVSADYVFQGGNLSWFHPNAWNLSGTPGPQDNVIIPQGIVWITGSKFVSCKSIVVSSGARLRVFNGSHLSITDLQGEDAIVNSGIVQIYGELSIANNFGNVHSAIHNLGYLYLGTSSDVVIKDISGNGIYNGANATFINYGDLDISLADENGIHNLNSFDNKGHIKIHDIVDGRAFLNEDYFINTGLIEAWSSSASVMYNSSNAEFINHDRFFIYSSGGIGLINHGDILNHALANIHVYDGHKGFYNGVQGSITNHGIFHASNINIGLENFGFIENNRSIALYTCNGAYLGRYGSTLINNDYLLTSGDVWSIHLRGWLLQSSTAQNFIHAKVFVLKDGIIDNYARMHTYFTGVNFIHSAGEWNNQGAIQATHNSMPSNTNNQELIVQGVQGPMHVGVPFPDLFRSAGLQNVTVTGIYLGFYNDIVAGDYNQVTNVFVPNKDAEGAVELFADVCINGTNNCARMRFEISGGVVNLISNDPIAMNAINTEINNIESRSSIGKEDQFRIFPNPSFGQVNIETSLKQDENYQLRITDVQGKLVFNQILSQESTSLNLSNLVQDGLYYFQVISEDGIVNQESIQFHKK